MPRKRPSGATCSSVSRKERRPRGRRTPGLQARPMRSCPCAWHSTARNRRNRRLSGRAARGALDQRPLFLGMVECIQPRHHSDRTGIARRADAGNRNRGRAHILPARDRMYFPHAGDMVERAPGTCSATDQPADPAGHALRRHAHRAGHGAGAHGLFRQHEPAGSNTRVSSAGFDHRRLDHHFFDREFSCSGRFMRWASCSM